MKERDQTRRERYHEKIKSSKTFPISIATVNFKQEVNLAYVIRAAVCFGASEVCVIGSYPSRSLMNELSGSLFDYIKIRAFHNPSLFLRYIDKEDINLISIELPPDLECEDITKVDFDFSKRICLVVGHETLGVPAEILHRSSEILYIPMHGSGSFLNTAQAANIALYEATKQYVEQKE